MRRFLSESSIIWTVYPVVVTSRASFRRMNSMFRRAASVQWSTASTVKVSRKRRERK